MQENCACPLPHQKVIVQLHSPRGSHVSLCRFARMAESSRRPSHSGLSLRSPDLESVPMKSLRIVLPVVAVAVSCQTQL